VYWTQRDEVSQFELENSKTYDRPNKNPLKPYENHPECVPMHSWQTQSYPTCNLIHETDLTMLIYRSDIRSRGNHTIHPNHLTELVLSPALVRLKAHGYFRDVYEIKDTDKISRLAFKTNRFERTFDAWTLDRHRMDALVMDRMTRSKYIMDIYGYCGVASLVEYATGDLMHKLEAEQERDDAAESWSRRRTQGEEERNNVEHGKFLTRLRYGLDVANAITDLHTMESVDGIHSSIVHGEFIQQVINFKKSTL
jgi:hypothetical protein